jgi:tetratricopeptide (TPR) repeat protein
MRRITLIALSFLFVVPLMAQVDPAVTDSVEVDPVVAQLNQYLIDAEVAHDAKDYDKTMQLLIEAKKLDENNPETLYKISRGYFDFADRKPNDLEYQKEFVYPGLEYAKKALDADPNSAGAHKWYAIHIGRIGEIEGTKQKILNSYEVKEHTMKAIELDPGEAANYHVMGRWHYALSELSWFERQVASMIYATPPEASFGEALDFFKQANSLDPEDIRNMLYIGHCYAELDDEVNAGKWYQMAMDANATSDSDRSLQAEAKAAKEDL